MFWEEGRKRKKDKILLAITKSSREKGKGEGLVNLAKRRGRGGRSGRRLEEKRASYFPSEAKNPATKKKKKGRVRNDFQKEEHPAILSKGKQKAFDSITKGGRGEPLHLVEGKGKKSADPLKRKKIVLSQRKGKRGTTFQETCRAKEGGAWFARKK